MVSDDERREIAARLRSANEHSCSPDCELRYALDGSHGCKGNGCTGCHRDAFDRLADLIDPGDMSLSCRDIVACDRDAMLALAADMDLYARTAPYPSFGRRVATYARRIREALGVSDDA